MIYLIQYNRQTGMPARVTEYPVERRREAEKARLEIELGQLNAAIEHEIVLLEAPSQNELRKTHRRYFEELKQLLAPAPLHAA